MRKINTSNVCSELKVRLLVSATMFALLGGVTCGFTSQIDAYATGTDAVDTEEASLLEEFRVKFVNYDGEELYNELLPSGTFITEPEVPERDGFTFLGWDPEVDIEVTNQDVVYTAQFVETGGGYGADETSEDVVVYDNDSNNTDSADMFTNTGGDFMNFVFMVILFLMETVWLHDRRSQQMRRYDEVMNMMDKE